MDVKDGPFGALGIGRRVAAEGLWSVGLCRVEAATKGVPQGSGVGSGRFSISISDRRWHSVHPQQLGWPRAERCAWYSKGEEGIPGDLGRVER